MNAGWDLKSLMLRPPPLTLAVAESLTCGLLQARVGVLSGASDFFLGGITAYALDAKVRQLGVDRATAEPVEAVSAEVARQMAAGVSARFGSDLGIATTGFAEQPPPRVGREPFAWWALIHRKPNGGVERAGRIVCARGLPRTSVQEMVADAVLGELVAYLAEVRRNERT